MYEYDEQQQTFPVESVADGVNEGAWEPYEDEAEDSADDAEDLEDFV